MSCAGDLIYEGKNSSKHHEICYLLFQQRNEIISRLGRYHIDSNSRFYEGLIFPKLSGRFRNIPKVSESLGRLYHITSDFGAEIPYYGQKLPKITPVRRLLGDERAEVNRYAQKDVQLH